MLFSENKNLIVTYLITLGVTVLLAVVIINFNNWFFPDEELELSSYTSTSRGIISERDLSFDVLSDQKFTALEPILSQEQLGEEPAEEGTTTTIKPSVRPPVELRYGNPFTPF